MPNCIPSLLLRACERAAQRRDVLVVPSVAVRDGGTTGDAGDLVAVVPPSHHAGILGSVLIDPLVALIVVVDEVVVPLSVSDAVHHLRVRQRVCDLVSVLHKLDNLRNDAGPHGHDVPDHCDREDRAGYSTDRRVEVLAGALVRLLRAAGPSSRRGVVHDLLDVHDPSRAILFLPLHQGSFNFLFLIGLLTLLGILTLVLGTRLVLAFAAIVLPFAAAIGTAAGVAIGRAGVGCLVALLSEQQQEWLDDMVEQETAPDGARDRHDGAADEY
mmetsp:Transcript_65221/g.164375  ORF Transcript_65221/g.164375 Transcript_65221/m.164375 type:complete len:271 (-) Transcript_65221:1413-2225(-)